MAAATICDGCGAVIEGTPARLGHVHTCDYCDKCEPIARDMMAKMDTVHDQLAQTWETKIGEIKSEARTKLKAIPDEPAVN